MHALIVGGTGMLAGVTEYLGTIATTVSSVARRPTEGARLNPIAVDYKETEQLTTALRAAMNRFGPIQLAVCWVHEPGVLPLVARELAQPGPPFRLVHVRGSRAADPAGPGLAAPEWVPPLCAYQQVVLGWQEEGGQSRWLSHAEISGGVIEAISTQDPAHIVGQVRPWAARPTW